MDSSAEAPMVARRALTASFFHCILHVRTRFVPVVCCPGVPTSHRLGAGLGGQVSRIRQTQVDQPSGPRGLAFLCDVPMPKTIQELTDEMNRFVEAMGWYREDSPAPQTSRNIAISLVLEAAEVLEHFQWDEDADRSGLSAELADVTLYLLQLAYLEGIDLEQAILDKLRANYERTWPKE